MPTTSSSNAPSAITPAITAAAQSPSPAGVHPPHAATGGGDNDSAALLWTLRANAVTPSKPTTASSSSSSSADMFTTPTTSRLPTAIMSSTPSSAPKPAGATPPSGRRGPGRPKKSESNSKSAAKWDDTVTALLLKFRYDDMRHEFEGVRNNVEVGECWIHLAQKISRLSGKSFDSHQCQSKLRNLKKSWREMTSSSKVVASATSPLYPLLSQYLGGENSTATSATTTTTTNSANNNSNSEDTEASLEMPEPRGSVGDTERIGELVLSATNEGGNAIAEEARAKRGNEEGRQAIESSSSLVDEGSVVDESLEVIDADEDAVEAEANQSTRVRVSSENPVTSRSRSDSLSSSSSSSSGPAPSSKRQKRNSLVPATSAVADTATAAAPTVSTIVAATVAPLLSSGLLQTADGRIDSSLLSVANGLRTMMEGVIASKEDSSEQQSILAELREHNALMKQYCEEVSKQTASLNALIDLLAAKFGNP